jgi:hypothetical protein
LLTLLISLPFFSLVFRNRVIFDLVGSISLGVVCGYAYLELYSKPFFKSAQAYDAKVLKEIKETHAAYAAESAGSE